MSKLKKSEKSQSETGFFQKLLYKYLPYWYVILPLTCLSLALGFFYLKYTPPVYESQASIMVKDEEKGQEDSKMQEVLNLFGGKNNLENQLEVLRSYPIISDVVTRLKLYAPITEEKGWRNMIRRSAYLSSPVQLEVQNPRQIKEASKVYFNYLAKDSAVQVGSKIFPLGEWIESAWGKLRFELNPNYKKPEEDPKQFYFSMVDVEKASREIGERMQTIPTNKQSTVINIKLKDEVPQRGEAILDALIQAYNQSAINKKNEIAYNTLQFIEDRLGNVKHELDSVENSIQQFRSNYGVINLSEQSSSYLRSMEASDQQMNQIKIQKAVLEQVDKYLESADQQGSIAPSTFNISDQGLSNLLTQLNIQEVEFQKLRNNTGENNPKLVSVNDEINNLKEKIRENVRNQRKSINASQEEIQKSTDKYAALLNLVPAKEKELVEVSRQRNTKHDIYSFLLQKKEQTAYALNSALPDSELVDKPSSSGSPVSPKKQFIYFFALIAGIGLSTGLIYLKDTMNTKILYREEIGTYTEFPVIGELLQDTSGLPLVSASMEKLFIKEQFRQIRTSLRNFGARKGSMRRLLITSSIPGEGKSFVSSNLALTIARSERKVALLELDLHRPRISSIFELDHAVGITDFLQGKCNVSEIIVPSTLDPNLSIIPAGNLDDSPSDLLVNGKLEELLAKLDTVFDLVVIDTAPIRAITDGYIIAPLCDLVMHVVRHGHTPKNIIGLLDEDMKSHNLNNLVIIFNGVKKRGFGKKGYGYGYGYGYDNKVTYDHYTKGKKAKIA